MHTKNRVPQNTMVEKSSSQLTSALIKVKGYSLGLVIGANDTTISLPADGSQLLGIAFDNQWTGDFSFVINNELVHEKIASIFAVPSPNGALSLQPFFPVNRKLHGRDEVRLTINSNNPGTINLVVYYK